MVWKADCGRGGLGVLVRVPGLVKPPSLVSSAVVALLLLQVDMQDIPRRREVESCSSSAEALVSECRALVRRDAFRSVGGGEALVKGVLKVEGRGVRCKSGGSSTSAKRSSSEAINDATFLGWFWIVRESTIPRLPISV